MKKNYPKSRIAIIVLITCTILFFLKQSGNNLIGNTSSQNKQHSILLSDKLIYTRHAKCRMDCRHISEAEIKEVIIEGHIKEQKSNANHKPCPTIAIEDYTKTNKNLRIVFAKCEDGVTKVVTCIELDKEFNCNCN
jgi:hypothetical protein